MSATYRQQKTTIQYEREGSKQEENALRTYLGLEERRDTLIRLELLGQLLVASA